MTKLRHDRPSFFQLCPGDLVTIREIPYTVEKTTQGGMGFIVFLQRQSSYVPKTFDVLGGKIALKAIRPDMASSEGLRLFNRELTVWSAFRHHSIAWLLEILEGGDAGWVAAMDWREGSLRDLLNEHKKLSLDACTMIMAQLIDGLRYAYKQDKVLHLDLKPENVLFYHDLTADPNSYPEKDPLSNNRYTISDWGIASVKDTQLREALGLPPSCAAAQRTFNNMGTMLYMAPERFREGFSSSIASDVFSLGMIYLEMLTGRLPYIATTHPVQYLLSSEYLGRTRLLLKNSKIPKPICSLILSMIAFSPSARHRDHAAVSAALMRSFKRAHGVILKYFY